MARTSTYLNFARNTFEAFEFYKSVFGTEYEGDVNYMGDVPPDPSGPAIVQQDKKLIMHIALPITGGHMLMGTDAPQTMGFELSFGNNIYINLEPDTLEETQRLFEALSEGGKVGMPLQKMFWGAHFGSLTDQFGVHWMFNCEIKS